MLGSRATVPSQHAHHDTWPVHSQREAGRPGLTLDNFRSSMSIHCLGSVRFLKLEFQTAPLPHYEQKMLGCEPQLQVSRLASPAEPLVRDMHNDSGVDARPDHSPAGALAHALRRCKAALLSYVQPQETRWPQRVTLRPKRAKLQAASHTRPAV